MSSAHPCPSCGAPGRRVSEITVKAQATVEGRWRFTPGAEWRFCATVGCPVVWYPTADPAAPPLTREYARGPLGQKEPGPDALVCHCFEVTERDLAAALAEGRETAVTDSIREGTRSGRCACEVLNPQGSCCLGNVSQALQRLRDATAVRSSNPSRA